MTDRALGIARDNVGWWRRYEEFARKAGLDFGVFEIERSDWAAVAERYQVILWRANLDPPFCEEAREKIYFLERFLSKRVVPNWDTFWHYDNKRAQAYLFGLEGVLSPRTFVSYSYAEAEAYLTTQNYPVVSKRAGGAGSEHVKLLHGPGSARREARRAFRQPLWFKALRRLGIELHLTPRSQTGYVLWQQLIPSNPRDLRITVIGKNRVFAFWRKNRPGDFRASGSGLIDYRVSDVEQECRFCVGMCRRNNFDTMAFDFVYQDGKFWLLEISCAYNDKAIYDAPGHFLFDERTGRFHRIDGHVWPQELHIKYVRDLLDTGIRHVG